MRVAVFGATGGTGRFVVRDAVGRGDEVTAFARRPEALAGVDGLARVVTGDGRDAATVREAVAGQDAVIVTVSGRGEPGVVEGVARAVAEAMGDLGVRRLVLTSAYGIVAEKPRIAAPLVRRIFARAFADQTAADRLIQATDLDWTIARATRLVTGHRDSAPRLSTELFTAGPFSITREAWAAVLVDLARSDAYRRAIVNVTG